MGSIDSRRTARAEFLGLSSERRSVAKWKWLESHVDAHAFLGLAGLRRTERQRRAGGERAPEDRRGQRRVATGIRRRDAATIAAAYADSGLLIAADGSVTRGRDGHWRIVRNLALRAAPSFQARDGYGVAEMPDGSSSRAAKPQPNARSVTTSTSSFCPACSGRSSASASGFIVAM